jgi:hypothetical protein
MKFHTSYIQITINKLHCLLSLRNIQNNKTYNMKNVWCNTVTLLLCKQLWNWRQTKQSSHNSSHSTNKYLNALQKIVTENEDQTFKMTLETAPTYFNISSFPSWRFKITVCNLWVIIQAKPVLHTSDQSIRNIWEYNKLY